MTYFYPKNKLLIINQSPVSKKQLYFKILKAIDGEMNISDVCLESHLTDLYVSFDVNSIDVTQKHNPVPIEQNTAVPHETDNLAVKLR